MIGMVLVTHGRLAREFHAALEHVVGPQKQAAFVGIHADDDTEKRREEILARVAAGGAPPSIIIILHLRMPHRSSSRGTRLCDSHP